MRALSLCLITSLSLGVLAGCTKQDEKVVKDEPKKATPVSSADLGAFNDFFPASGGAGGLAVKLDGGGEGGLPPGVAAGAGGTPAGGAEPAGATPPEEKLKVTDAGGDPKASRKYAFVANKVDKRIVTIAQEQQRAGARGAGLTLVMNIDFTPKKVEPKGTHFELKVNKVEVPQAGLPPQQQAQLAQALGGLGGMTGGFEISPRGEVGEVSMQSDQKMQNPLAEGVVQGLSQITELLVPAFPEAPIGVGAKWERQQDVSEAGAKQSRKASYTLKEVNAEGGVVDVDVEIKVPKRAVPPGRGVPPGTTVSADGKGKYTYQFRFDHVSTSVKGELVIKQHIEAVDESGKKQAIDDVQVAKQTIETPK
jgi:hypothetical protein